ncbi:MAG TPA: hypothetical protein VLA46_06005 [Saprospiraceae bacterium]|nr:hypothetical protein [Saprospiraceae bacterium]
METKTRLRLIFLANHVFLVAGILISFKLWLSDRAFPLLPVYDSLPVPASPIDLIIILVGISLMAGSVIFSSRILNALVLCVLLVLLVQDQMRWQPWVYHYFLFLVPFCLFDLKKQTKALSYFQFVMIGIYLWSGLHKLNADFINHVFPVFAKGIFGSVPVGYLKLGYMIPLIQILIAVGLYFTKTRKIAVVLGILTHLSVLIWLSPAGGNNNIIVLPWNLAMITFLCLCFWNSKEEKLTINLRLGSFEYLKAMMMLLVFVLPALNVWGYWDYYLSFNLYSGKNKFLYVAVEETELHKLKYDFSNVFMEIPGLEGGRIIDVNKWSLQELNVLVPPEARIFKALAGRFCEMDIAEDKIMVLEFEQPVSDGRYQIHPCGNFD